MKHHLAFFTLCGTLLTTAPQATAQVFIPDTLVRNWLNGSIPGIVDVNGIMDTSHVGIATLDSVDWSYQTSTDLDIDLTGSQYLDSAAYMHVTVFSLLPTAVVNMVCPAVPPAVKELVFSFHESVSSIDLPALRSPLQGVWIGSPAPYPVAVSIAAIEDTLENLSIQHARSVDGGPSTGYIENLIISPYVEMQDTILITAPDWDCGYVMFYLLWGWGHCIVDLADMSCRYLDLNYGASKVQSWPALVEEIQVSSDEIDHFPPWPAALRELDLHLALDVCLPMLPNELRHLGADFSDCVPNIPDSLQSADGEFIQGSDTVLCSVLNSACPGTGAALAGRLFIDSDSDGVLDAGEVPMPMSHVQIQPNNALVSPNSTGWWERGVLPGIYTIAPATNHPYVLSMAPAQHSATFNALGEVDSTNYFGYTLIPNVNDLHADLTSNVARPGHHNQVWITYLNQGTTTLNGDLVFTFDTDQSWVGSTPAPTSQAGNTATWDLPNLPMGAQGTITVTLHTDAAVPLGTPLLHNALIDPLAGDTTPTDNTANLVDTVVGAFDPNDKLLDPHTATLPEVQADDLDLIYTIRFQNTGTFQAERVVIVDTLSDQLQWSTFQFLGSSHACDWYMLDGVLHFIFDPILLPDSGSNEAGSHGFVRFSMRPSTQLQLGETVSNIAHIVFDFNEAIVTLPVVFLVDNLTGVTLRGATELTVMPNPTRDRLRIDGFSGTVRYRIRDIGGRIAQSGTVNGPGTIEVVTLSPGTYFLEVDQDAATRTVRFVRER